MCLGEIAQWFGSAGQYIGEHRLRLGRAGFGGLPRPGQSGGEVRLTGLVIGKQSVGLAGLDALCEAVHAQRREQTLGFEMPTASGALQPARSFYPAGRYPSAFQIGVGDPVFRLDNPGPGQAGKQRKRLPWLTLIAEPERPAQCHLGRGERDQPVNDTHLRQYRSSTRRTRRDVHDCARRPCPSRPRGAFLGITARACLLGRAA